MEKIKEKSEAIKLFLLGNTVKEIVQLTKVTEKTVRGWLKGWQKQDEGKLEIIQNLEKLLKEMSLDKDTPKHEIMYVSVAIKNIYNTLIIKNKEEKKQENE